MNKLTRLSLFFSSPKYGIRALSKILLTYRSYGLTNIYSIINRYAPPSENNTENYKEFISARSGVGILYNLENTIEDYFPIVKAMIEMEMECNLMMRKQY
jgi:hypothetical protein